MSPIEKAHVILRKWQPKIGSYRLELKVKSKVKERNRQINKALDDALDK
jgi:hypothetical protein